MGSLHAVENSKPLRVRRWGRLLCIQQLRNASDKSANKGAWFCQSDCLAWAVYRARPRIGRLGRSRHHCCKFHGGSTADAQEGCHELLERLPAAISWLLYAALGETRPLDCTFTSQLTIERFQGLLTCLEVASRSRRGHEPFIGSFDYILRLRRETLLLCTTLSNTVSAT